MPRYDDGRGDRRGVHRRRLERRGSNTPIIVGTIVIGAAIVGVVLVSMLMGGKMEPEEVKGHVRTAARRFLEAAFSKDADQIWKTIDVEAAHGWVNDHFQNQPKLRNRYRLWDKEPDRDEAMKFRQDQDRRILTEARELPGKMALDDIATIDQVVKDTKVRLKMTYAEITIRNKGGEAKLILQGQDADWHVVNWKVGPYARGR